MPSGPVTVEYLKFMHLVNMLYVRTKLLNVNGVLYAEIDLLFRKVFIDNRTITQNCIIPCLFLFHRKTAYKIKKYIHTSYIEYEPQQYK